MLMPDLVDELKDITKCPTRHEVYVVFSVTFSLFIFQIP